MIKKINLLLYCLSLIFFSCSYDNKKEENINTSNAQNKFKKIADSINLNTCDCTVKIPRKLVFLNSPKSVAFSYNFFIPKSSGIQIESINSNLPERKIGA